MILYSLQTPTSGYAVMMLIGGKFKVWVDGNVVEEIDCFSMAFAVMISCYWLLNIEFPKNVAKTLHFISLYILKSNHKTPSSVSKMMKTISSFR